METREAQVPSSRNRRKEAWGRKGEKVQERR